MVLGIVQQLCQSDCGRSMEAALWNQWGKNIAPQLPPASRPMLAKAEDFRQGSNNRRISPIFAVWRPVRWTRPWQRVCQARNVCCLQEKCPLSMQKVQGSPSLWQRSPLRRCVPHSRAVSPVCSWCHTHLNLLLLCCCWTDNHQIPLQVYCHCLPHQ